MRVATAVGSSIVLLAAATLAAPGDGLVVTGDVVNVRAGPGTDYPVRLKAHRDQAAVELAREGEWVQLQLADGGGQGWIHESLLAVAPRTSEAVAPAALESGRATGELGMPPAPQPTDTAPASEKEALARFRSNVDDLNARARALAGVELFTGAEPVGSGAVRVLVTDAWQLVPEAGQESYTNALFGHWRAVAGGSEPLRLQVVDPSGTVVIEKSGPASP